MALSASRLSALTRLFSSAVFKELAQKGRSPLFSRLLSLADIRVQYERNPTVGDAFNSAFSILKSAGKRDEYIYRAAITHKILLGKHSLRTSSLLTEFRAGSCKADLVIINGTATAYEIKSERDSLARLSNQIYNYKKVFASVNVIASEDHIKHVCEIVPREIGVLFLSNRHQISVIREALNQPDRICPKTAFDSLRSCESIAILKAFGIEITDTPNTLRHTLMREHFAKLRPEDVHHQMIKTLKQTRNLAPLENLLDQLPKSLHAAALSIPVRRGDHSRLTNAVKTPLGIAFDWS